MVHFVVTQTTLIKFLTEFEKGKTRVKQHNSSQSAKNNESGNNLSILDRVRLNNADRLIIDHLNINSLRNKFEMLREIVQDKLDILLVSETKVDPSFPLNQFAIKGFSVPFRLDRNSSGGGIMLFVREEIPSKLLSEYKPNSSVENIFFYALFMSWINETSETSRNHYRASHRRESIKTK